MDERSTKILRFLHEAVGPDLTLETELMESGLMDSFKAVTLIAFIETEFQLRIDPSDVTHAHLTTPAAIARFVEQLQNRALALPT